MFQQGIPIHIHVSFKPRLLSSVMVSLAYQVPVLAIPWDYMQRLSSQTPLHANELKAVPIDRKKKWIDLAEALSKRAPTQSTQRTVQYLLWLCHGNIDNDVAHFQPLPWHERAVEPPRVDLSAPSVLSKLCPAMHFRATLK